MQSNSMKPYEIKKIGTGNNYSSYYVPGHDPNAWQNAEAQVDAALPAPEPGSVSFPTYVDSTMLAAYKSCPRRFFWEFCRNLHPKRRNVHFTAGGAYAKGMEVARRAYYEQHLPVEAALHLGFLALTRSYGDYIPPEKEYKTWERTAAALISYFKEWPLDRDHIVPHVHYGRPMIEYSFAQPIPGTTHPETGDPILLSGRTDMIVNWHDIGDKKFIYDDKTTKSFSNNWAKEWQLRGQFTGYCWSALQNGVDVVGAIIRGTAIQKTQIKHLDAVSYRHDWEIDRWLRATQRTIDRMCEDWTHYKQALNNFHSASDPIEAFAQDFDSACTSYGGCGFAETCDHKDPEPFLEMGFEFRVWNPLAVVD